MKQTILKRIGVVISERNDKAIEIGRDTLRYLLDNGINLIVYPSKFRKFLGYNNIEYTNSIQELSGDIIISIGGDGTVLRTFLFLKDKETPVMGIGLGEKNFLASIPGDNFMEGLKRLLDGKFYIRREMRLNTEIEGLTYTLPPVLNEVLFITGTPGKTIDAYLAIDKYGKEILWSSKADGVLISTPVGSTAYAFAADGPVLDTDLDAILIVPLLPVDRKPIYVVNSDMTIHTWASEKRSRPMVVLDGQITIELECNQVVKVFKADTPANLITFDKKTNIVRLRKASGYA